MSSGKKNIVWLASYPKSGNTWVRIFLSNLLSESDEPIDINDINLGSIASSRSIFDDYCGIHSSDLTKEEIERLRPNVYRKISEDSDESVYIKVHDAWQLTPSGEPLFPEDVTKAVVYIIRHPLDVALSFSYHNGGDPEKTIKNLFNEEMTLAESSVRLRDQIRQVLLSWENHVKSWTESSNLPLHIMKYEAMKQDPFTSFKGLVTFLKNNTNDEKIKLAIQNSSIDELRKQELEAGFKEKPIKSKKFFREGKSAYFDNIQTELTLHMKDIDSALLKKYNYGQ